MIEDLRGSGRYQAHALLKTVGPPRSEANRAKLIGFDPLFTIPVYSLGDHVVTY